MAEKVAETVSRARDAVAEQIESARESLGDVATDVRQGVRKATKEVRREAERVSHRVGESYDGAMDNLRTGYDRVRKDMAELSDDVGEYVRDNPGKSIAMAAGVGFLLGLLFRPRDDE